MNKYLLFVFSLFYVAIFWSCDEDPQLVPVTYNGKLYDFNYGSLPTPDLPTDNVLTIEAVKLGRMLFYEKLLSKDNSQSCASCHQQKNGFSDLNQFSKGVEGKFGNRQAMPVFNLAWHNNGFFWDGRAPRLRDQALKPIQDPLEMNETIPNVINKLSSSQKYVDQFDRAFTDGTINDKNLALALEQFMFTIVSYDSKYDQFTAGITVLSEAEERGRKLFFTEFNPSGNDKGAECFHCHAGPNFTNDEYMNNGLDSENTFMDLGREKVSSLHTDKAKFLTPSLRNIALTAPYMHDGRIKTLEEVVEHYAHKVKPSPTLEFILQYNIQPDGLQLSAQNKADLVSFLKTLSDPSLSENKAFSEPN